MNERRWLTPAMDNVLAWRLGEAFALASTATVGDRIDRGLALRRALEDKGFALVAIADSDQRFAR